MLADTDISDELFELWEFHRGDVALASRVAEIRFKILDCRGASIYSES